MSGNGRRTKEVTITEDNRDNGKRFLITEMSAVATEDWAARLLLALTSNGFEIPQAIANAGIAGVASLGIPTILKGLKYEDAKPLLKEMLDCVQFKPDPNRPDYVRKLINEDVEEVGTLLKLRAEVFTLHTGFSIGVSH